ncbi:MAG TPA: cupredoxin domain-containing protein [Dissulfurispiraceae bacterium]|nr:cupredoxin domain-containing protein [Dissulfurispiraceae bacterium]
MKPEFKIVLPLIAAALSFLLSACAGLQQQVEIGAGETGKIIEMEAASFTFTPNNIKAYQGETITIRITNSSDADHDFTLKDPAGAILQGISLPARQTAMIKVVLADAGVYTFYCDKPFHSLLGMKGQIESIKRQKSPAPLNQTL